MSKLFPHLFTPGKIGSLTLKNRIMKAPQSSGMSNMDGTVSERLVRYYRQQAAGGAGMIIVEYAYVDDIGAKSAHCHLGISNNEHIPGLAWLAENIREQGAVPAIQIEHCGRQKFLGTQPICAPSAIPWPKLWDQYGVQAVPHVLTIEEIQDIVHAFGDAALRAKQAGFELVEIHGAHGYLLTNFFSPTTNHRTDLYGGSLENRMRIYVEIVRDVRKKVGPDFPVTIRLSGTDYEPDGFPIEDTIELAKVLEKEGIDAFHISGGDHHTMIHQVSPMAIDVCHNVWAAEAIKKVVHVPVIASGSITLPEYAEEIIASGKGDFVGLGRPLWADPEWPLKAMEDRPEDIRPCIRCNEGCLERTFFNFKAITCAVNPTISREGELDLKPAAKPRKIAVVGGGPAGMEAARVCKLRGHEVTLFEEKELGGLLHEASVPEFKSDIRPLCKYLITQIEKLGIPVEHKKATAADLAGYDAVICATGSRPILPGVPGIDKPGVMDALEVLNGARKPEGRIAVIGGGLVGTETALHLAEQGMHTTLVEMLPKIMNGVAATDQLAYSERIAKADMEVCTGTRLVSIGDGEITVSDHTGTHTIPADSVIIAIGLKAQDSLYGELCAQGKEAYLVGDAVHPGKIFDAFHTAYRVAWKI
ncbi:FAD-dependent oxidoreductase [Hydrogenoanaerobacterium saccharovorans]|uniref:FAD-dependent oxidoreductase n=1 Tax=Hydrogenoanaerobacterium saccharovorans TaxID=474960 RepID=A0ABS2GM09_9FIRM|nr:FAD-dependent oxidoreductase [Hydrogenoanaerobacterium saccharovorans]MBM6922848.1 FAD-dependent oxidoreductase [Hydrogenoanaerobacterium saccharovorans]